MKLRFKVLLVAVIASALLLSTVYIFLALEGRQIVIQQLEDITRKKVSLGQFRVIFPLNIRINNLDIEGIAKMESISVSPSILGLFVGNIVLNDLTVTKPEFTYERFPAKTAESAVSGAPAAESAPAVTSAPASLPAPEKPAGERRIKTMRLVFKRVDIKDGKAHIIDHGVGKDGVRIMVKDISFNLTNFYVFPRSVITNFKLQGNIPWQEGAVEGKIETEGWIDLLKKNMQATLNIRDIDGIYLYPYYAGWVNLEKARIEKAKLNFASNIQGLNNDVTANCHLELTDIVFKPRPPEEQVERAEKIAAAVLDIFKSMNQGKIVLDFTIRTKMDRPEFGFVDIQTAFEDKITQARKGSGFNPMDIASIPAKILEGTLRGATDITKAVIIGTFTAGNEVRKGVEGVFRKEPKEEKTGQ